MADVELVVFLFSHFCEKARWALDLKGVAYRQRVLLPGLHIPVAKRLTGGTTVPILIMDGQARGESSEIIAWLDRAHPEARLIPDDPEARARALDLQRRFDADIGPHLRRAAYGGVLDDTAYMMETFGVRQPRARMALYRAAFPVTRRVMCRAMRVYPDEVEASKRALRAAMDALEASLQPSGYLVGDTFTVADLAGAALLSPLIDPELLHHVSPATKPAAWQAWADTLRGHGALDWAEGMYRAHRGASREV